MQKDNGMTKVGVEFVIVKTNSKSCPKPCSQGDVPTRRTHLWLISKHAGDAHVNKREGSVAAVSRHELGRVLRRVELSEVRVTRDLIR